MSREDFKEQLVYCKRAYWGDEDEGVCCIVPSSLHDAPQPVSHQGMSILHNANQLLLLFI